MTTSIDKQLRARLVCVRSGVQILNQLNLIQSFSNASRFTQVVMLTWTMPRRWTPQTCYTLRLNPANILVMKGWFG